MNNIKDKTNGFAVSMFDAKTAGSTSVIQRSHAAILAIAAAVIVTGCVTNTATREMESYELFVDSIRDYAMEAESPDGIIHAATATVKERHSNYEVVFVDAQYASYRCEDYEYTGGAHGNTNVHVGTLDRKTGKKLALGDVFPTHRQKALEAELQRKASEALAAKGQKLFEPDNRGALLTDNFCLMEDGWHFVYSPYEIAPFAAGVVDVVIPRQ